MADTQLIFQPKDAPVSYQEIRRDSCFVPHYIHVHNSHELCFVPSCCAFEVFSGGNRWQVQGPALIFHRAGCFHELLDIKTGGEYFSQVVHFFTEALPLPDSPLPPYSCSILRLTKETTDAFSRYFSLLKEEAPSRQPLVVMLVLDKLQECRDQLIGSNSVDNYIFSVLQQLSSHPEENPTISQLADAYHVSPSKLKQDFTAIVGMPIRQYIIRQRMQLACKLLQNNAYSLAQIAYACGFCSQSHFTAAFRGHFGMTPKEYAKGGNSHV